MINKATRSGTVHAAWNTGREYSENKQRISAQLLSDGRVAFSDIDRNIDGICHEEYQDEVIGEKKVNPVNLAKFVMREYDEGRYNSGFYALEKNGGSFESVRALAVRMKDAAKSIGPDGKGIVSDLDKTSIGGALDVLRSYSEDTLVSELYDHDHTFSDALNFLIPDFEYPDFSHRKIGDVIKLVMKNSVDIALNNAITNAGKPEILNLDINISEQFAFYADFPVATAYLRQIINRSAPDRFHFTELIDADVLVAMYGDTPLEKTVFSLEDEDLDFRPENATAYALIAKRHGLDATLVMPYAIGGVPEVNIVKSLKSRNDAEAIAIERGTFDYADLSVDRAIIGKVMGVTDKHVVLNLGRSATILAQSDLSRVPAMNEVATIAINGGKGVVADTRDQTIDKGR